MEGTLREKRRIKDGGGRPSNMPSPPSECFTKEALESWKEVIIGDGDRSVGRSNPMTFSSRLRDFLVMDLAEGTLSRPEDAGLLEGWGLTRVKAMVKHLPWVEETSKEDLAAAYLGARSLWYFEEERETWVVDKGFWVRARDDWLLGHIMAFSMFSEIHGERIGRLPIKKIEGLREIVREVSKAHFPERRRAFATLDILMGAPQIINHCRHTMADLVTGLRREREGRSDGGILKEFLTEAT
ncbi:hypothetical protein CBR_g22106 [Chara braunii]|uniref:Uncharacterized protein n=1 Tax=Chara braunii TaxID=69332 RepID=A0A388L238_CHABU|nr:hypothetical protein CBR_g22106 [Chara braunii]|eukprot:GBG76359.1 hypothetical protein CBR_g22106 [Chara braunii]